MIWRNEHAAHFFLSRLFYFYGDPRMLKGMHYTRVTQFRDTVFLAGWMVSDVTIRQLGRHRISPCIVASKSSKSREIEIRSILLAKWVGREFVENLAWIERFFKESSRILFSLIRCNFVRLFKNTFVQLLLPGTKQFDFRIHFFIIFLDDV